MLEDDLEEHADAADAVGQPAADGRVSVASRRRAFNPNWPLTASALNPDFNQPNESFGTSRSARIQLRYAF